MTRAVALGLLAALLVVVATAASSGGGDDGAYRVQAVFDDAPVNTGADVLVAGVRVGVVDGMEVTQRRRAALTLKIEDPRFVPFRADARCSTRLQSPIGERVVTCEPGTPSKAPLPAVDGTPLLPVTATSSSVDLDLVTAISGRPANEQMAILLTELGASTAARGPELAAIVRRANPALGETERVLRILSRQADDLEGLAADGDRVMRELVTRRRDLTGLVRSSTRSATAAVDRRTALDATLRRLPAALDALEPLMARAADVATRTTPVLRSLGASGRDLAQATETLAPFARRATPALVRLGATARAQQDDLPRLTPLARKLATTSDALAQPADDLGALLTSLSDEKGIDNLLGTVFGAASSANGFDARGHYVRGQILSGACGQYTNSQFFGCDAQFGQASLSGTSSAVRSRVAREATAAAAAPLLDFLLADGPRTAEGGR